ncbi:MAG: hypothetical protein JWP87_6014 [Labilithrix sp.]|nr:hypothetical protein [Labilithrix sp.]
MSGCFHLRFASAVTAAVLVTTLAAPRAYAQSTLPPSQPPPASAQAPNGEYIAPLQQPTQQVYMPQSVALSGPRVIKDYDEGEPIPPGYHAESRVRSGLVVGGAVTFGVLYLLSVLVGAAISDTNKAFGGKDNGDFLYVPVAGPFLQMTRTESSSGNVTLAIDGIAQAAGATMLIVGITSPKTVLVRNDLGEVRVLPMRMGDKGGGLGLVGTF